MGVLVRPRGVRESTVALAGATAVLVLGAIDPAAALNALAEQWNVFLFFIGLMTITAIADQSGLIGDLVIGAARAARGRADVLFVLVCVVAFTVTVTLTNDATVLLLTPLVIDLAARLRVPVLPYAYACALLANASSAALPIANPANILVLRTVAIDATAFASLLLPSAVLASIATLAALLVTNRRLLSSRIVVPVPDERDAGARFVAFVIGLIVAAYLVALQLGWPVGMVAVAGGAALVLVQHARGYLRRDALRADIAWGIFPLLAGLIVVLRAAQSAGLVEIVARSFALFEPTPAGIASLAVASAGMANAMNNLPWALLASAAAAQASLHPRIAASLIVGIDVGPSFTTLGSLATLLWLALLRRRGVRVSSLDYMRAAALPAAAALTAAILPLLF